MPRNLRMIAYSAMAAAAATNSMTTGGTLGTALTDDSLTMEDCNGLIRIVWHSQLNQTNGGVRLVQQSGHDQTVGKPMDVPAGDLGNLLGRGIWHGVHPNEVLKPQVFGTAVSGDVETGIFILERDIDGGGGNYIDFNEFRQRRDPCRDTSIKSTLAAAAAGYGTGELINSEQDHLWAGFEYAITGFSSSSNVAGIWVQGPDTGGTKYGCPCNAVDASPRGSDFFCELSRTMNMGAFIPVIKANNKANTRWGFIADENLTSISATMHLAMLHPKGKK